MKIVYLGSDVALPVLQKLVESEHEILAVACNIDKPNARGNKIVLSKTKQFANEHNIKVLQYKKIRAEGYEDLKALNPDIIVSAAFGQIISQEIIDLSKVATLNVHPSLLPKYRGPSPIVSAIMNGDLETGVSIMGMVLEVDAGPVYKQKQVKIEGETAGDLTDKLFEIGGDMLLEVIDEIKNGTAEKKLQDNSQATYCYMIKPEDAKLDFSSSCEMLNNKVRALNPTPIAFFEYLGEKYKVFEADYALSGSEKYSQICAALNKNQFDCGEIVFSKSKPFGLVIKAQNGFFMPKTIQAPNCKVVDIKSFLNGKSFIVGEKI